MLILGEPEKPVAYLFKISTYPTTAVCKKHNVPIDVSIWNDGFYSFSCHTYHGDGCKDRLCEAHVLNRDDINSRLAKMTFEGTNLEKNLP